MRSLVVLSVVRYAALWCCVWLFFVPMGGCSVHLSLRRALRLCSRFMCLSLTASIAGIAVTASAWGEEMKEDCQRRF